MDLSPTQTPVGSQQWHRMRCLGSSKTEQGLCPLRSRQPSHRGCYWPGISTPWGDLMRAPLPPHPAPSSAQPEGWELRRCTPVHPTPRSLLSQAGLTGMTQRHITALTRPKDGNSLL